MSRTLPRLSVRYHATPLEYERVFRTNLLGVIHGAKAFLPRLLRQRSGHIVNISSVLAQMALPTQSAYCASKSAVSAFTECLARECEGSGVAVSLVIPAGIRTEFAANLSGSFQGRASMIRCQPQQRLDLINRVRFKIPRLQNEGTADQFPRIDPAASMRRRREQGRCLAVRAALGQGQGTLGKKCPGGRQIIEEKPHNIF